ncbi:hypothetical protein ABK040_013403 [Willaertia magna]
MSKRNRQQKEDEEFQLDEEEADEFLGVEDLEELENDAPVVEEENDDNTPEEENTKKLEPKKKKKKKGSKKNGNEEIFDDEDDGKKLEAGIIEEIHLKNFMCHSSFTMKFHDRTTIISGQNGSGKSAVLTAIQVCLGARAKSTNRGKSGKDLVLTGKDHAEIKIKLRNQGNDAYKRTMYGKSIIVIKRIDKSGVGTYRIQNCNGKTISTSSKELHFILEKFNIQIDNPTTVMSQDVAREFLAGSSESKKYQFYLKATQLQSILDGLEEANKCKDAMEIVKYDKERAFEESTEELNKRKKLYEEARKLGELQNEVEKLQKEKFWALVEQKKHGITQHERKKKDLEEQINQLRNERAENIEKRMELLAKRREEVTALIKADSNEIDKVKQAIQECVNKKNEISHQVSTYNSKKTDFKKSIKFEESKIREFEKFKKEIQDKDKVDKEGERKKRQDEIDTLTTEKENEQMEIEKYEEELKSFNQSKATVFDKKNNLSDQINGFDRDRKHLEKDLTNLRNSQTDKLALLGGERMKNFLADVQNQIKKFSRPPIGPIGLLVRIRDEHFHWAPAVQVALQKLLTSMIVHSFEDFDTLDAIKKKHNIKVVTYIQSFKNEVYDVSNYEPDYLTALKVLDIDTNALRSTPVKYDDLACVHATTLNTLIDQSHIHQMALIENRKDAEGVIFSPTPPRNVAEVYTITGTRLFVRGATQITTSANATSSTLWTKDVAAQILEMEREVRAISNNIKEVDNEKRKLDIELRSLNDEVQRISKLISRSRSKVSTNERKIQDLQKEISEIEDTNDDDKLLIEEYNQKISECKANIEKYNNEIAKIDENMEKVKGDLIENAEKRKTLVTESDTWARRIDEKNRELVKIMDDYQEQERKSQTYNQTIASKENQLDQLNKKLKELQSEYEATKNTAIQATSVRLNPSGNVEEIEKRISSKKRHIDMETKRLGNRDFHSIENDYKEYEQTYLMKQNSIEISEKVFESIKKGLSARNTLYNTIKNVYNGRLSEIFGNYMSQRGHTGKIKLNEDSGTLVFDIHMSTHGEKVKVSDAKSLSGGEKSFTTVSFLLALWEVSETPFRALDEFDVFMDNVYRKTAMDLILDAAKTKHFTKQLIIITPQDVSMVKKDDEYLKIVHVQPPKRLQNQRSMEEFLRSHQQ